MSELPSGSWSVFKVRDDASGERFAVKFVDPINEVRPRFSFSETREVSESELRKDLESHGVAPALLDDYFARARSRWTAERPLTDR